MSESDVTIDGIEYVRVYAAELALGMVNPHGETVVEFERFSDDRSSVVWQDRFGDATTGFYGNPATTVLVTLESFESVGDDD